MEKRQEERERQALQQTLHQIREWLQTHYEHVKAMETRYEGRFFHSQRKRIELDRKIDQHYRQLVKKILEMENRMGEMKRVFLSRAPRSVK